MGLLRIVLAVLLLSTEVSAQNVVINPTGNQNIVQPANTSFSANNYAGIRYVVTSYSWQQSFPSGISAGLNTVTLNCPAGILAPASAYSPPFFPSTEVWISTVGTPEAVLVTATTCLPQGGANGTITFTAQHSHGLGYTIGSASAGIQEAVNAANFIPNLLPPQYLQNGAVVIPPGEYVVNGRITILGTGQSVEGNGAILTCNVVDACLFIGDYGNSAWTSDVVVEGLTFRAGVPGVFAMIEDNGQHSLIRNIRGEPTNNNPPPPYPYFDSMVEVDNDQAATVEGLDGNLAGAVGSTYSWARCDALFCSTMVTGANANSYASVISIKDSDLDAECLANGVDVGTGGGGSGFAATAVVSSAGVVTGVNFTNHGTGYTAAFPVTFTSTVGSGASAFAVVSGGAVTGVVVTRGGSGYSQTQPPTVNSSGGTGNTLKIKDSVIQAYPQFGIRYKASYFNLGLVLDNVYQEIGTCPNPLYPQPPAPTILQSQAGVIALGSEVRSTNGATGGGNFPQFCYIDTGLQACSTSGTSYTYWIVGHSTGYSNGRTVPLLAGSVLYDGNPGSATIYWPQMCQRGGTTCGTVTYDVLRAQGSINDGMTVPISLPGYPSLTGSIVTGTLGSCSDNLCSVTDTFTGMAQQYTVNYSTLWNDALAFWPGSFVLTASGENATWEYGSKLYTDVLAYNAGPIVSTVPGSTRGPSVYAQDCSGGPVIGSPLWMSCLAAEPEGGTNPNDGPTALQNGVRGTQFPLANPMGRIILEGAGPEQPQDFITFYDSNQGVNLFSQPGLRPSSQLSDCAVSGDGNANTGYGGLALRCYSTVSNYIGALADGSSWLEQLSASAKKFTVPLVLSNGTQTTTNQFIISPVTPAASRTLTIADPRGNAFFGLSLGTAAIAGPTSQISAGTCNSLQTGTINNVTSLANTLIVTPQSSLFSANYLHLTVDAYISSTGIVTLEVCNPTASNITPGAITFNVRAF